jgi:hypothetical protein
MTLWRQHRGLALLFVALSLADLALTWHLLRTGQGAVYEANWVADGILARFGFPGLALYKVLIVALVATLVCVVAVYRPRAARRLALFACAAVGVVVVYSVTLWGTLAATTAGSARSRDSSHRAGWRRPTSEDMRARFAQFHAEVAQARAALIAGCCSLPEAVAFLADSEPAQVPGFLEKRRARIGAETDEECLAAFVMRSALAELAEEDCEEARERAGELLATYRATHGETLVAFVRSGPFGPGGRSPLGRRLPSGP